MLALKNKSTSSPNKQNSHAYRNGAVFRIAMSIGMALLCNISFGSTFDVPAVVPAVVDQGVAKLSFTLSSVAQDTQTPPADRWIVKVRPRASTGRIVDYSPRTQTASDVDGPVVVKMTDEASKTSGLSIDANYLSTARAHLGADNASKKCESTEFRRHPQLRAVIASGTFDRSRGVIFKMTASPQTVLEGEKTIELSFEVASDWRGGILDVEITTTQKASGQYPWESTSDIEKNYHFAVALFRSDDPAAQSDAEAVSQAETRLWHSAGMSRASSSKTRGLLNSLASTFERSSVQTIGQGQTGKSSDQWVGKMIAGKADPHLDPSILRLPMDQRMLALEYIDARDRLATGPREIENERVVSAKPPIK